jgi:peptide-methionine (S)-S-oxide reductase
MNTDDSSKPALQPAVPSGDEKIILATGCFWCTEAVFAQIPGVISVTSGYSGGTEPNPTYQQVCAHVTGHAECIEVVFDPQKIALPALLTKFWHAHDPTQVDGQGNDLGPSYRSAIFYFNDTQKKIAEESKAEAQKEFSQPIATEITKAGAFWPAEKYHQDYYDLNKNRNPYCQVVIAPKLKKLGLKY